MTRPAGHWVGVAGAPRPWLIYTRSRSCQPAARVDPRPGKPQWKGNLAIRAIRADFVPIVSAIDKKIDGRARKSAGRGFVLNKRYDDNEGSSLRLENGQVAAGVSIIRLV